MSSEPIDDEILIFGKVKASRLAYIDFVAKYQGDPVYKARVDRDPVRALRDEGFEIPDGVEIKLLQSTDDRFDVVVPNSADQ